MPNVNNFFVPNVHNVLREGGRGLLKSDENTELRILQKPLDPSRQIQLCGYAITF